MNPIVFMWSHPRSMSTATERIMRERGDFECVHEPFLYYYYEHLGKKSLPHFDADLNHPREFDEIVEHLRSLSRHRPVFAKDMSYYVIPEILYRPGLAADLTHLFLIRDPRKSILSYYGLDPDLELDEIGLEAQWTLYRWILTTTGSPPLVIEAEAVQDDPVGVMGRVWNYLGVPFLDRAFEWSEESVPSAWQQVAGWHGKVGTSSGIRKTDDEDEHALQKRFDLAVLGEPKLQSFLDHQWPYYRRLKQAAAGGA